MPNETQSRPKLSFAVIVRNDAEPLRETLESIKPIADEVIVLDTGSTDESIAVAEQAGAKVSTFAWCNDFAAARNHCFAQVSGDWVLWLDAGETLTDADAQALRTHVDGAADRSRAYLMLVVTPAGPAGEVAEQIGRIRLVPRVEGLQFAGRVRESLEKSLAEHGIETDGLPMRIHRGQREHDPELKLRRARRDLVLAEQEMQQAGADPRLLLTLAEAFRNLGKRAEASELYLQAIGLTVRGSHEMLEAYYGVLATCGDGLADALDRQINLCLEALEIYPVDAQLLCALGGFLVQRGQIDLGVRSFETSLAHGQVNPLVSHLVEIEATAAICAATALVSKGERSQAKAILEKGLALAPDHAALTARLAELNAVESGAPVIPVPKGFANINPQQVR